jgi:glyoxylate carboligase
MARIRAVEAAVLVLEREGISVAFGVPGAAINPFYAALRKRGSIRHILARHVEGASHMADGYTPPASPVIWVRPLSRTTPSRKRSGSTSVAEPADRLRSPAQHHADPMTR